MELYGRYLKVNEKKQLLSDHINGVYSRVDRYSENTDFNNLIKTIALAHDAGKASNAWQSYLMTGKNRVPHSNMGIYLVDKLIEGLKVDSKYGRSIKFFLRDIIGYVIGAHHGLFDTVDNNGNYLLDEKVKSIKMQDVNNCLDRYKDIIDNNQLNIHIKNASKEMENLIIKLESLNNELKNKYKGKDGPKIELNYSFFLGVIVRMLLSMQIDGDWSDAANFEFDYENKFEVHLENFSWDKLIEVYEDYIKQNFTSTTPINLIRTKISDECKKNSEYKSGIYKLYVPTGGGKTIAAFRFALHHAKKHSKERVFYIAPYNSILEQNAKVYRNIFKVKEEYILEHHSNVMHSDFDTEDPDGRYKYLTEKWSSPIILTSMVQLLNAFFSADKKSIRRLHRLKNSVVIIDEMQALPFKVVSIFNTFINAMSKLFGTTFILCTATQPPYERIMGKLESSRLTADIYFEDEIDLVSNYENYLEFNRVIIKDKTKLKPYSIDEIENLIIDESIETNSIMLIANTRRAVDIIFNRIKNTEELKDYEIIMLSNNMCAAHRMNTINKVREKLNNNEKIVLVSTNLIEAGVDLSMSKVIRSLTGLDSIAQAAGRCNRNGEMEKGEVIIINIDSDIENTTQMKELREAQETTRAILEDFKGDTLKYDNNLLSKKAIEFYFKELYKKLSNTTHYLLDDNNTIYDLIGKGSKKIKLVQYNKRKLRPLNQSFLTAGMQFRAIDDLAKDVIVPYGEGLDICNKILSKSTSIYEFKSLLNKLQHYTVSVYSNVLEELLKNNALVYVEEFDIYLANENYYDNDRGLVLDGTNINTFFI